MTESGFLQPWGGTFTRLLVVLLAALCGCGDGGRATPDGGSTVADRDVVDSGIEDTLATGDQSTGDQGTGEGLGEMVSRIVSPYVDPSTALTDLSKTVGMVVAVCGTGASGVYGFGAVDASGTRVPDGDTIFQIGSVSKILTGLVLAREVTGTSGLTRDDLVETYLPALQGSNGTKDVTLGMLVTHYSGLDDSATSLPRTDPFSPATGYALADLQRDLFALAAPVQVDDAYNYANVGMGLLGLALQKHLAVQGYHDLLHKALLRDVAIGDLWGQVTRIPADQTDRIAQGYAPRGRQRVPGHFSEMGVLASAGEAATTGNAMLTLLKVLSGQQTSILDATISESLEPLEPSRSGSSIAYGINVQPDPAGPIYNKEGSTAGGYTAYIAFRRTPSVGVVVMTNVAGYYQRAESLTLAILAELSAAR